MYSEIMSQPVPLEQRALHCDACGRSFLLSYRRPDVEPLLGRVVVTSVQVRCPWLECQCMQLVVVPVDGYEITVAESWGTAGAGERSLSALRAIPLEDREPAGGTLPRLQRHGFWQALASWLRK